MGDLWMIQMTQKWMEGYSNIPADIGFQNTHHCILMADRGPFRYTILYMISRVKNQLSRTCWKLTQVVLAISVGLARGSMVVVGALPHPLKYSAPALRAMNSGIIIALIRTGNVPVATESNLKDETLRSKVFLYITTTSNIGVTRRGRPPIS